MGVNYFIMGLNKIIMGVFGEMVVPECSFVPQK
jgi:hypothetical protein